MHPSRKSHVDLDGRVSLKERDPVTYAIKKQKLRMAIARFMGITPTNGNKAAESGMSIPDGTVDGVWVSDQHVKTVADTCNVQLPVLSGTPWMMNNVIVGSYLPAIALKQLFPGLDQLADSFLQGKRVRQFAQGQFDKEGNDIGGFFVLSDVAAAVLYKNAKCGGQYANNTKQVNLLRAPSLKYVDAGHPNVSYLLMLFTMLHFIGCDSYMSLSPYTGNR